MKKYLLIVGARPQFIKAAPIISELHGRYPYQLLHTGQHYDDNMSANFFHELNIPEPDVNLGIHSRSRPSQIGDMLVRIASVIDEMQPDWILVFGDTNSTLAGALAASNSCIPLAHLEAGLRSYRRQMPEEVNRVLTDHISDLLFCPSQAAVENLAREGITAGVHLVGDLMMDTLRAIRERLSVRSTILARMGLSEKGYLVVTIHRAENTQDRSRLDALVKSLLSIEEQVVFPLHPRTRKALDQLGLSRDLLEAENRHLKIIDPLGYLDMVRLVSGARIVLTDSGGLQKEAYWLGVPCITLREETEWIETVEAGWNVLVGIDSDKILRAVQGFVPPGVHPPLYGDGCTARRCIDIIQAS